MNKLLFTALISLCVPGLTLTIAAKKQKKIEQLFELTTDKQTFIKAYEPILAQTTITTKQINEVMDNCFIPLKKDYAAAYDKFFSEEDIDVMLNYHQSPTGKRVLATAMELQAEMQDAYMNIMTQIQGLIATPEESAPVAKSAAVIHFDELANGKTDAEMRELFKKEITHDGFTVVKFSATWCPPCKTYAPIFDEVAEQLKELSIDGSNVAVKYVAVDIDTARVIAEDCAVKSVPTTIFYKNGKKVDLKSGSITKDVFRSQIHELAK